MKIKKIHLKNLGPLINVTIEPRFSESGQSIPIAVVGQNGAGKSLALAVLLDAMTEGRRNAFSELQEVNQTDYLRVSSKHYIQHAANFSHAQVIFETPNGEILFNEIVSRYAYKDFIEQNPEFNNIYNLQASGFEESGFYKNISIENHQKSNLKNFPFLYFPYFRYEAPYWMNEKAKVDFVKSGGFYGQSKLNPIRTNFIEETKRWILNIILDRELYEKNVVQYNVNGIVVPIFSGYDGPNTKLFALVNEIIFTMMKAKDPEIEVARIGIGRKNSREISVFAKKFGQEEDLIAPDISQLSSGELMTLGLATEIIRAHELITGEIPNALDEVYGIVLIDEIDLHLHISFQKSVLPKIIRRFPKVQFLFSSHSPFFLLGMAESGEIDIYNFPLGNKIPPEEFNEFQAGYDFFVEKNNQFQKRYKELEVQIADELRPLIITEGKTDWRHLKFALKNLQSLNKHLDLDIRFFDSDSVEMGDVKLRQMCEYFSNIHQKRKMIFVFDRDNPTITNRMSGHPQEFKDWGNNVFSLCLPVPLHRQNYKKISIELYYTDDVLARTDPQSGKRLWFSNNIEMTMRPTNGSKVYKVLDSPFEADEFEKKVFDDPADKIIDRHGNYVGFSKFAFSQMIVATELEKFPIDFEAFSEIFKVLEKIAALAQKSDD